MKKHWFSLLFEALEGKRIEKACVQLFSLIFELSGWSSRSSKTRPGAVKPEIDEFRLQFLNEIVVSGRSAKT